MTILTDARVWWIAGASKYKRLKIVALLSLLTALPLPGLSQSNDHKKKKEESAKIASAVLWEDPADITSRDLFAGEGGRDRAPASGSFVFQKEDLDGTNPKYVVKDASGVKWKIKLGAEVKPETAASRLVWAVGYFANEDYYLPEIAVGGITGHIQRGKGLIGPGGAIRSVRLKREDEKKLGDWEWKDSPFQGTREWYGLRVLMALMNNWDLKDVNNGIYAGKDGKGQPARIYMVSDLGASFGKTSETKSGKGKLALYRKSKFIVRTEQDTVNFSSPGRMPIFKIFALPEYILRARIHWLANDIPRPDARWMGDLLGRLSQSQIEDAFRAAGYPDDEAKGFTDVVEHRIARLREL